MKKLQPIHWILIALAVLAAIFLYKKYGKKPAALTTDGNPYSSPNGGGTTPTGGTVPLTTGNPVKTVGQTIGGGSQPTGLVIGSGGGNSGGQPVANPTGQVLGGGGNTLTTGQTQSSGGNVLTASNTKTQAVLNTAGNIAAPTQITTVKTGLGGNTFQLRY